MKKLFCVFLFLPLFSLAQNMKRIDSLNVVYKSIKVDTLKVQILKTLAWEYYHTNFETASAYAAKLIHLSKKINYKKGVLDGYNFLGVVNYANTKYDSALYWFNRALNVSNSNKYHRERIYAFNYAGHTYSALAQFGKADSCFFKVLEIGTAAGDKSGMAKGNKALGISYYTAGNYLPAITHFLTADSLLEDEVSIDKGEILHNIGVAYHAIENFKAERAYYKRALAVYQKLNDDYGANTINLSLAALEIENKEFDKAIALLSTPLAYFEQIKDPAMLGEIQYLLGRSFFSKNQYTKALDYFNDAVTTLKDTQGSITLNHSYRGLGDVYAALNKNDQAFRYYDLANKYASAIGEITAIMNIMKSQAALYYKVKNFQKAYDVIEGQQILADSANRLKSSKVLHEIEAKYQNEKKEQQIKLLEAQSQLREQEKNTQRNIFIAGILAALILIAVLYFLFRVKKSAHRKLKELDTLKSRFFANISHEFRTPLTLIVGPIEEKLHTGHLEEKERADFEMIQRNSKQLLGLVDQLLDLSKIESGGYQLKIEKGDISQLLLSLAASFEYAARRRNVNYQVAVCPTSTDIWYDKDAIEKITVNLLSNAVKYTPEKGIIRLTAEVEEGKIVLVFENSGPGIAIKDQHKIFDRFYQQTGEAGGAGIGLALVKELIDLLKGKISVSSIPDQFTIFKVVLPVNREAFPKSSISTPTSKKSTGLPFIPEYEIYKEDPAIEFEDTIDDEKPVLLIVEDNKDIVRFIRSSLEQEYHILEAANGKAGVEVAIKQIPDIIVSDVMMPVMDGIELSQTLKSDERTSHIPIILLTAKAGEENKLVGFETGADDYITKPFNSVVLKVRLKKLIATRKVLQGRFSQEVVLKPKEIAITSADQKFLEKVQQILDARLTNSEFTAEAFSKEIGMSRMQLHRKLKGLTGLSANHFIRMYRIKMAATILVAPGINISEVGYMVGFNNPSYFAKCFKEFYKCTPTEFVDKFSSSSFSSSSPAGNIP